MPPVLERPSPSQHALHHVAAAGADGPADGRQGEERLSSGRGDERSGQEAKDGFEKLASGPRQVVHHHGIRGAPGIGKRMAAVACTFGAIYSAVQAGRRQLGGHLCEDHHHCQAFGPLEVQREAHGVSELLHPSQEPIERRRQQDCLLRDVQDVPLKVGVSSAGVGDQRRPQETEAGPLESNEDGAHLEEKGGSSDREGHRPSRSSRSAEPSAIASRRKGTSCISKDGGDEGARAATVGDEGKGSANAGDDVLGDESKGGCGEDAGRKESKQPGVCQGSHEDGRTTGGRTSMSLPVDCLQTEVVGRRREHKEGKTFLGVQDRPVRVLPMGGQESHSDPLRDDEQPEAQQKPKDSIQEECWKRRVHPHSGQRLSEGWAEAKTKKGRQALRRMQAGMNPHFEAPQVFQVEVREGEWEDKWVPLHEDRAIRVPTEMRTRTALEDFFGAEKETQLNHKQRKEVMKGLSKVSEVFSPPRIAAQAGKDGLRQGSSFDLITGWDLSNEADRKKMWRALKEEDPILLILCPPCTAFSARQSLNFPRMDKGKVAVMIQTGMEHLELAMALAKWQHRRGRYFLFEHPASASSWKEATVEEVESLEGVEVVSTDMCMYGMNVNGLGLNKKPTKLMSNSEEVRRMVNRRCDRKHFHAPTLCLLPKKAQEYPPGFCKAVVKGIKKQILKDAGNPQMKESFMKEAVEEEGEDEEEDLEDALEKQMEEEMKKENRGEKEQRYQVTEEEKSLVMKLHRGLGHPQKAEFVRFMRAARIRGEIIRWAYQEFTCPACQARSRPKAARPAAIPRTYQPGRVLGIDLIFLPEVGGERLFPALSMVDWGSNYQMVERVTDKQPGTIWSTLWSTWGRTFGLPEVIISDAGKEFSSQFMQLAASHGIVTQTIAARAPWQNGRTERHGAHYKELLEKAREEALPTSGAPIVDAGG